MQRLCKEAQEWYQIFLKKKKAKGANMLVSDIEIFQKKKKKRSVNMIVNDIKNLLEDEKQRLAEYIKS